jgi:hypothetical protein
VATLKFYLTGTLTAADALTLGPLVAGTSAYVDVDLRNTGVGGTSSAVRVQIEGKDPSDHYVLTGLPFLDEHYFTAQVIGVDNAADTSMPSFVGQETPIGADSFLEVPAISGGCAYVIRLKWAPPQGFGAASEDDYFQLRPVYAEIAQPAVSALPDFGQGVLTSLGNPLVTEFVEPPTVSASTDHVDYGRCWWLDAGRPRRKLAETVTFDGNAADGALGVGEEYQDVITLPPGGGAFTQTKGNKATAGSSVVPTPPAGELYVETRTVPYGLASTSGTGKLPPSRLVVEVVSGLTLRLCLGRAFSGIFFSVTTPISFTVDDDATTYIYITSVGGGGIVKRSSATAGTRGDFLAYKAVAASGAVMLTGMRTFLEPGAKVLRLQWLDEENASTNRAYAFVTDRCYIDRVRLTAAIAAAGATGDTILDINRLRAGASVTLFTNQGGSPESRPVLAAGAYTAEDAYPEVTELEPGDVLVLDCDEATTGGTQASFFELAIPCAVAA